MTDDAQRLHALERDVREMALMMTGPLADTERLRAIAARLAEPRGEAPPPGPYSTVHTPDLAERVEMARAFVDANSPQYVAPTDEPSGDELWKLTELMYANALLFGCHREEALSAFRALHPEARCRWRDVALAAWRWCRARMVAAPPAAVEEIAEIIRARNHAGNNRQLLWLDPEHVAREITARIPAPVVPAEIVERAKNVISRAQEISGIAMASSLVNQALAVLRDLAAQPAPAPDPRAAGEREA